MTEPYKKRAKAGWNRDKQKSNRAERRYEEVELKDQTAETSKVGKPSKKLKNSKQEKEIISMIRQVRWALKSGGGTISGLKARALTTGDWYRGYLEKYYQEAKKAVPKLRKFQDSEEVQPKIKRMIREILESVGSDL